LTFVFLLKRHRFDFFKKKIDPADPVTRSKPGTRALDRAGFENYVINASASKYYKTMCLVIVYFILFNNVWYGMVWFKALVLSYIFRIIMQT